MRILLKEHIVNDNIEKNRYLLYSVKKFVDFIPSKKGIKKAIKRGELLLNDQVVEEGRFLKKGDSIKLFESEIKPPKAYNLKLEILFEDDFLAVIKKPAGIVVSGNRFKTIVNALQSNIKPTKSQDALKWSKPVHRLDAPTSGLLLIAKTHKAIIELSKQFEHKTIEKKYQAIVIGEIDNSGTISEEIEGREAITDYKLIKSVNSIKYKKLSLLELTLHTGRTHQIRIHLSNLGFPILGDNLYGIDGKILKHKGLFLSAVKLRFTHPINGEEINITLDTPYKFLKLMKREESRTNW